MEEDWRLEEDEYEMEEEEEDCGETHWFPARPPRLTDEDEIVYHRYLTLLLMDKIALDAALREGLRWIVIGEGDDPNEDEYLARRVHEDPLQGMGTIDAYMEKVWSEYRAAVRREEIYDFLVWLGTSCLDVALWVASILP